MNSSDFANSSQIKKIYEYIAQNYQEKIKVQKVAAMLNIWNNTAKIFRELNR